MESEQIVGIIPDLKHKKGFLKYEPCNVVVTASRLADRRHYDKGIAQIVGRYVARSEVSRDDDGRDSRGDARQFGHTRR